MSKHTPGPWSTTMHSPTGQAYGVHAHLHGARVNVINWGGLSRPASAEGLANAHLIAAAPEMLDALIEVADYSRDKRLHDIARAAIAKATGEKPKC